MDRQSLSNRAGTVGGIYGTIATIVLIIGGLAMIGGFIQAVAAADDVLAGVLVGVVIALAIGVYVVVAWAGVQLFALVARYIQLRSAGEI